MSLSDLDVYRSYELRLLRSILPPSSTPSTLSSPSTPHSFHSVESTSHPFHSPLNQLLRFIESGDYSQALSSEASLLFLRFSFQSPDSVTDSSECAERVYSELVERIGSFINDEAQDDMDKAYRVIIVSSVAIAAFLIFSQSNMTGPLEGLPRCPLAVIDSTTEEFVGWDNWARNQLMSAGSDLFGKFSNLQHLVFAKALLMRTRDLLFDGSISSLYGTKSIPWWLARVLLLEQRILDERSSTLFNLLQILMSEALHHFGTLENVRNYWGASLLNGEDLTIVSMVHLEAGIMEYYYARVDACRLHFESAESAAGFQLSITGVLGFRTVHQVEPKAQMVLVANESSSIGDPYYQAQDSSTVKDSSRLHKIETSESTDILLTPKLLDDYTASTPLSAIQQAVILAKCLLIERSSRHDEMQRWDMAPYIEAIDSQQSSYFLIRRFCEILRVRWESTRSRTKERALLMMEKLVQGVYDHNPGVAQRIYLFAGVYIPTIPALRKEYGELLVRCGLIGEAVKVFEELELWDNLIFCYRLLEKKAAAVELIKTRLSEVPNDPRLWCSLGDVTNNDDCYKKALEVSNNRSARAKRALARSAYNRGDYEASKVLWESAMTLNSLYPDGWFALGAAALKARDVEKALDGFTRAVQLDPENGEAWNNIACLHMIKKKSKEAFIAFKEALKFKRNSWQLWENFGHVAVDVSNLSQALEAINMVLDITSNKRVDRELLERIMVEVERRVGSNHTMSSTFADGQNGTNQVLAADFPINSMNGTTSIEYGVGRSGETEHLVEVLGKILQKIVRAGNGADIWGIYARWHKIKGDLVMCSEALLKQVRSYQGSDLWKDRGRFNKFAQASLELCKVYMEISTSTGSKRELFTAEMHLRNTLKQAECFADTQEFGDLQACIDEVKMRLQSNNVSLKLVLDSSKF